MANLIVATLDLNQFKPVGKFTFSFKQKTSVRKSGATILSVIECNTTHLPFKINEQEMKAITNFMKNAKTDVLFDGMHCFTVNSNALVMVSHPLISAYIKAHL